jgi:hypothetical protein
VALFEEHVAQATSNFKFLETVNQTIKNYHDWQVTTCFYTALHLVNAHLTKHSLQYRQHKDVNHALNPEVPISVSKLPFDEYAAYISLQRLSRRSRYLVNEKDGNVTSEKGFFTYEVHLARAIRNLDKLVAYFNSKYNLSLPTISFTCSELSQSDNLKHVTIKLAAKV